MAVKAKRFRIGVEGATTDGRTIERAWLEQMTNASQGKAKGKPVCLSHGNDDPRRPRSPSAGTTASLSYLMESLKWQLKQNASALVWKGQQQTGAPLSDGGGETTRRPCAVNHTNASQGKAKGKPVCLSHGNDDPRRPRSPSAW
jgi:hypothetical protein